MRGPTQDARLEAIAGVPVVDVNKPTLGTSHDDSTYIFVGRFAAPGKPQDILGVTAGTVYVAANGNVVRRPAGPNIFDGPYTTEGQWLALSNYGVAYCGLGRFTAASDAWQGPMRALVYNHALTDYQIQRVIHHLMRELKQQ